MIRNRPFRVVVAALIACLVGLIAAAMLGFLLVMAMMFVAMPQSGWAGILVAGLLLVIFGVTFVVSFREMREKLAPDPSQSSSSS